MWEQKRSLQLNRGNTMFVPGEISQLRVRTKSWASSRVSSSLRSSVPSPICEEVVSPLCLGSSWSRVLLIVHYASMSSQEVQNNISRPSDAVFSRNVKSIPKG